MPNPFNRRAYGTIDEAFRRNLAEDQTTEQMVPQPFAGGDLAAYINNIRVSNLEAVTFSSSVEVVGNYALGSRDALSYTRGKRVIVGSMSMTQWDRHVLLHQVFNLLSTGGRGLQASDLFAPDRTVADANKAMREFSTATNATTAGVQDRKLLYPSGLDDVAGSINTSLARGLARSDYNRLLQQAVADTIALMGSKFIKYADQIPPFDLTLVGTNPNGATAFCSVHGITITQETGGFSMNDLGNTVGLSFVALHVEPWRPIWEDQNRAITQMAQTGPGQFRA